MPTPAEGVTYEFGPFRLDTVERVLTRDGIPLPLAPKVTDTLLVLLECAGHLVTKEELLAKVWPDTFVDESNLSQNVFRLRRILGDESYIETVPRRGYRFVHPVRQVGPRPATRRLVSRRIFATFAAAAVIVMAARFAMTRAEPMRPSPELPSLQRITTDSRDWDPAISPDGRFVAYAALDGENKSIWLKNLGGGSAVEVMPPTPRDYRGLRFSPDGREIFYKTFRPGAGSGVIERVPLFGGAPVEVASGVWSDFALSPDGAHVAFVRGSLKKNENTLLVVAGVTDHTERVIARNAPEKSWFYLWDTAPSWSPDGQHIVFCGGVHDAPADRDVIFDVRAGDGTIGQLRTPPWSSIEQAAFLGDGSTLAVVARENESDAAQVWMLDASSGSARRVTNDLTDYRKLSATADGRTLVVERLTSPVHVWVVPDGASERAKQLTFGAMDSDGRSGLAWTPDGRILFTSNRTGQYEIWSMKPDGSDLRQLTAGSTGWNHAPRPTRDGRYIVFASMRTGKAHIWRIDADGANPLQLTDGHSQVQPDVSPDGKWVYYTDPDVTPSTIERVPIEGGAPQRVVSEPAASTTAISPDGALLAHSRSGAETVVRAIGGGELKSFRLPAERGVARWTADSRALVYAKFGTVNNLWAQPLDGSAPVPLTHFSQEHVRNFAIAPDGKSLVVARGSELSDIVLLTRFR